MIVRYPEISANSNAIVCEREAVYAPRQAEESILYGVVAENLETFLARQERRDRTVPRFVEREFRSFLDCGIPARGFLRIHCDECGLDRALPFSCRGRGFCESCGARRMADEIPGAGQGYRVLQFAAPVSNGASCGPLTHGKGLLIGMITKGSKSGMGFAVPAESIAGLADGALNQTLGNGAALQMPSQNHSPSSAAVVKSDPNEILCSAKTIIVRSRTMYFAPDILEKEFGKSKGFDSFGLMMVKDPRIADLFITIDCPLFTYDFTYSVTDAKTSIVLNSGKVMAIDGGAAAGQIAKKLTEEWVKIRAEKKPSGN